MGEYVLTFFIVITVMAGMSLYLKRVLQGRIRDAKQSMEDVIRTRAAGQYVRIPRFQYEPYYLNTSSVVDRDSSGVQRLSDSPGFSSGVFDQTFDESTSVRTYSNTVSPRALE